MMDMLKPYKWLLDVLIVAALAIGLHFYNAHQQGIGAGRVQAEWDRAKVEALTAQRDREQQLTKAKDEAIAQAQTQRQAAVAAAGTAAAAGRLLDSAIQARGAALAGDPSNAVAQYTTALGTVLSECQTAYRGVAAAADGHATDSLMYQRAWPAAPPK
jgi:Protein of unknown function (DUF2514)